MCNLWTTRRIVKQTTLAPRLGTGFTKSDAFGVRALENGVEVEGIWIAGPGLRGVLGLPYPVLRNSLPGRCALISNTLRL